MKCEVAVDVNIPDEYELVRIGIARPGEDTVNAYGEIHNWIGSSTHLCLIVKRKYRDVEKCDIGHYVEVSNEDGEWTKRRLLGIDSECSKPYIARGVSNIPGSTTLWQKARIRVDE